MFFLSHENQVIFIEAFNSTSRYLNDLLNVDNDYFEHVVKMSKRTSIKRNLYLWCHSLDEY